MNGGAKNGTWGVTINLINALEAFNAQRAGIEDSFDLYSWGTKNNVTLIKKLMAHRYVDLLKALAQLTFEGPQSTLDCHLQHMHHFHEMLPNLLTDIQTAIANTQAERETHLAEAAKTAAMLSPVEPVAEAAPGDLNEITKQQEKLLNNAIEHLTALRAQMYHTLAGYYKELPSTIDPAPSLAAALGKNSHDFYGLFNQAIGNFHTLKDIEQAANQTLNLPRTLEAIVEKATGMSHFLKNLPIIWQRTLIIIQETQERTAAQLAALASKDGADTA